MSGREGLLSLPNLLRLCSKVGGFPIALDPKRPKSVGEDSRLAHGISNSAMIDVHRFSP